MTVITSTARRPSHRREPEKDGGNKKLFLVLELGGGESTSLTSVFSLWTSVFLLPDGTMLMDVCMKNTDVREVGFHPPLIVHESSL